MKKTSRTTRKSRVTKSSTEPRKRSGNSGDAHKRVVAAARSAVRKALKAHKAAGDTIVVWENGKVVKIPAAKIPV